VLNFTARPVAIKEGDRIAQGVILPIVRATWMESTPAAGTSRGGFGSTGQ
jgi:dUTP pyrophosphatase